MILQNKLSTLTEEEQMVLVHAINAVSHGGMDYQLSDMRLVKLNWLRAAVPVIKSLIKPEHVGIVESLEKKLL